MTVIVLGMHRSRTSLVSHICSVLGVHMGDKMLGTHPSQPHGHWEDVEFYELNQHVMQSLGGKWDRPPTVGQVQKAAHRFRGRAAGLVARKSRRARWGWKDPRTCITLPVYWPFLTNRVLVFVERDRGGIVKSLMRRSGGSVQKWNRVIDVYDEGLAWARSLGALSITVDTDLLVMDRVHAVAEVKRLSRFLSVSGALAKRAVGIIHFK